jgi:hypothetical protein
MTGTQQVGTLKHITIKTVLVIFHRQNNILVFCTSVIWWRHLPAASYNFFSTGVSGNTAFMTAFVLPAAAFPQQQTILRETKHVQTLNINIIWGAIHQLLSIILKLRILVLLPVSTMPYVVKVKNYS